MAAVTSKASSQTCSVKDFSTRSFWGLQSLLIWILLKLYFTYNIQIANLKRSLHEKHATVDSSLVLPILNCWGGEGVIIFEAGIVVFTVSIFQTSFGFLQSTWVRTIKDMSDQM